MNSIHQFKVEGLNGKTINFADYAGKKILVVNVASECGYTPQYAQMQELFEECADELMIIGFPCNDFGGQEPHSAADIQEFCRVNYGVTFPIAAKISILKNTHPVYEFLTKKSHNGLMDSEVKWNFHKYLLDEDGQLLAVFPSAVSPFEVL